MARKKNPTDKPSRKLPAKPAPDQPDLKPEPPPKPPAKGVPAARPSRKTKTPAPPEARPARKRARGAVSAPVPAPARRPKAKAPAKRKTRPAAPTPVNEDADSSPDSPLCGLSVRQARCVDLYLLSYNAGQAYVEAGFVARTPGTAHVGGSRLLSSAKGRAYLAARTKAMFENLGEQQAVLMRSLTYTAFADPRELSEHYRGACRFCHGKFNRWQYTAGEWDGIITKYVDKQERAAERDLPAPPEPDAKGGTGYDLNADPNPDCPECGGEGRGRTVIKDTRHLSPAGVALYAGVKETKDGIEVKMHDQMKARETLAKIAKLFDDATTVKLAFDAQELTAKYAEGMAQAAARMALMREERRKLREDGATPED